MNNVVDEMERSHLVPTVEAADFQDGLEACRAINRGGIHAVEVMFRTDAAAEIIRAVKNEIPEMVVGAGTVLDIETAEKAKDAGAGFIVAPGFDPEIQDWCTDHQIQMIPGVMTPTEITMAWKKGIRLMKFFPADISGGTAMLKALSGPFRNVRFLVTGGINENNMKKYLDQANVIACGGSFIAPGRLIKDHKWEEIAMNAEKAFEMSTEKNS